MAVKRESPERSKNREFSGEKRRLMEENSLTDVSTQNEGISNLISSYVVRAPKDNSLKTLRGAKKSKKERSEERWER
jgi:hypothetical protein